MKPTSGAPRTNATSVCRSHLTLSPSSSQWYAPPSRHSYTPRGWNLAYRCMSSAVIEAGTRPRGREVLCGNRLHSFERYLCAFVHEQLDVTR
jgi:hypothetical protein